MIRFQIQTIYFPFCRMVSTQTPIEAEHLTGMRLSTILICFLMNMLDGMNVMVISYTSATISATWNVAAPSLGIVFSAGLLGMAIGGIGLSPLADRIGRRSLILVCALLMGMSMILTMFVTDVMMLSVVRLITGVGIGGMLASTATLASEYAPKNRKDFWVSLVMGGYPIGAVLSGLATAEIIAKYDWQHVFLFAGLTTLATIPLIWFFQLESLDFILKVQPGNALHRANKILQRLGKKTLLVLEPPMGVIKHSASVQALFDPIRRASTLLLWTGLFMAFATLYFLTSWIPKLAADAGLSIQLAIYAGTLFNLGAFFGIATQGYLSGRFGLRRTICAFLILTSVIMFVFGLATGSDWLLVLFTLIGFGIQGGFVGLYAIAARLYPTEIRATGVGWGIGMGRAGGIAGPLVGGVLIGAGFTMVASFIVFAFPLIIGGIATISIKSKEVS